jgi:hypothetical protein
MLYKSMLDDEVSSLYTFCNIWKDEVQMLFLVEGFVFIKYAKSLDVVAYSDFILFLVPKQVFGN